MRNQKRISFSLKSLQSRKAAPLFYLQGLFILFIFNCAQFQAQKINPLTHHKKLGLVLSGGGAKGMAHLGVLKVLDSLHLKVNYIGGTSMGSIVSALYACGYSASEIESRIKNMNWSELFNDEIPLDRVSIEEKMDHQRFLLDVAIVKGKAKLPSGFIRGPNLYNEFVKLTFPKIQNYYFDSLPVPLRINAVDLEKGENIVFDRGYLPGIMRASMSIPSVFYPVEMDSGFYVDGGVIRNSLIPEIKALNPDYLIVSFTGNKLATKDELNSFAKILGHVFFITGSRDVDEHDEEADLFIQPVLSSDDAGAFKKSKAIIAAGDSAAMLKFKDIEKLAQDPQFEKTEMKQPVHNDEQILSEVFHIDNLVYNKLDDEGQRFFEAFSGFKPNTEINLKTLFRQIQNAYSSLRYEYVYYEMEYKGLTADGKKRIDLKFHVTEAAKTNFRLNLHYDTDLGSGFCLNLITRDFLIKRSRMVIEADLAQSPRAKINYLFFIDRKYRLQIGTMNQFEQNRFETYNDRLSDESYSSRIMKSYNYLQLKLNRNLALNAGYELEFLNLLPKVSSDSLYFKVKSYNSTDHNLLANLQFNSLNRQGLPTKGTRIQLSYRYVLNSTLTFKLLPELRAQNNNENIQLNYKDYGKWNLSLESYVPLASKLSYFINLDANAIVASVPNLFDWYSLGSIERSGSRSVPLYGYRKSEVQAMDFICSTTGFQLNIVGPFYAKAGVSGLIMANNTYKDLFAQWNETDQKRSQKTSGFGLSVIYLIPKIGPLSFTVHKSFDRHQWFLYASLGYKFQLF